MGILEELATELHNNGGQGLYLHAGGRPEFTDENKTLFYHDSLYQRARRNLLLSGNECTQSTVDVRKYCKHEREQVPPAARVSLPSGVYCIDGSFISPENDRGQVPTVMLRTQWASRERDTLVPQSVIEERIVKKKGIAGLLGGTEVQKVPRTVNTTQVAVYPLSLRDATGIDRDEDAYITVLDFKSATLRDSGGRGNAFGYSMAYVHLVTGKQLATDVAQYLAQHPSEHVEFLRAIFPSQLFPNVSANVLSHEPLPFQGISYSNRTQP